LVVVATRDWFKRERLAGVDGMGLGVGGGATSMSTPSSDWKLVPNRSVVAGSVDVFQEPLSPAALVVSAGVSGAAAAVASPSPPSAAAAVVLGAVVLRFLVSAVVWTRLSTASEESVTGKMSSAVSTAPVVVFATRLIFFGYFVR
jgi:hypothetical protein